MGNRRKIGIKLEAIVYENNSWLNRRKNSKQIFLQPSRIEN